MENKMSYIPLVLRRFIEIIVVETALSAVSALLAYAGVYGSYKSVFLETLIVAIIYFGWTVYCLISFRFAVYGTGVYFLINTPFYALLSAGAIICGMFETEPVYSFLFAPFKFFHYAAKCWSFPGAGHMSRPVSAALMCAVFAIPLLLIPVIFSTKRVRRMSGIPIETETQENQNNEA